MCSLCDHAPGKGPGGLLGVRGHPSSVTSASFCLGGTFEGEHPKLETHPGRGSLLFAPWAGPACGLTRLISEAMSLPSGHSATKPEKTGLQSLGVPCDTWLCGVLVSPSFRWLLAPWLGGASFQSFAATWHSSSVCLYIATFSLNTSHTTSARTRPELTLHQPIPSAMAALPGPATFGDPGGEDFSVSFLRGHMSTNNRYYKDHVSPYTFLIYVAVPEINSLSCLIPQLALA